MRIEEHDLFNRKAVKIYFVELDDDNRERVISGIVNMAAINLETDYARVESYDEILIKTFPERTTATLTATFVEQDGVLFKHETWEDEEPEDESRT